MNPLPPMSKRLATALLSALLLPGAALAGALGTEEQRQRETLALEVLSSAPVRAEAARLEALYRADPQGKTAAGAATIRRGVDAITMAAVNYAVTDDPARPAAYWTANGPHRWFGLDVPRSGYGIDNPDNVYRNFRVDGSSRYEISGRVSAPGPVEQHFTVMDAIPGTTPLTAEGGGFVATLRSDALAVGPDGRFTITVDSSPAAGRPNHLTIPADCVCLLIVRDLFTDWGRQNPVALEVRRTAGPDKPARSSDEVARRAAAILGQIGPYWVEYDNRFVYFRPANVVSQPRQRPGGRGLSVSGHFRLAEDEALVLTIDPLGASSLGVQITDPWGVAYEYGSRTSSLNNAQAQPNPDGTFTFVIAAGDPGAANWLDPEGHDAGMLAVRWQGLTASPPEGIAPVREARVVKLAGLKVALPQGTRFLSPDQREEQRRRRAADYGRRLTQ